MTNSTERSVYLQYSVIIAFSTQSALQLHLRWTHLCDKKCDSNDQTFSAGGRERLGARLHLHAVVLWVCSLLLWSGL